MATVEDVSIRMYSVLLKRQLKTQGHSLRTVDLRVQNQAPRCHGYDAGKQASLPILLRGQAVSRQLPNVMAQFRFQVRASGFCGGQNGIEVGIIRILRFPLQILIPPSTPH
jgi:hypothetical protein